MSGWERPINKETPYVAEHVNQIIDVLTAQFGITDTIQTNLGRLAVPAGSGAPAAPIVGSQWLDTSLGGYGRLFLRDNGSHNVPYLPLRQVVKSTPLAAAVVVTSTSFVDVGTLTLSITTTGGQLEIECLPGITGIDNSLNGGIHTYADSGTPFSLIAVVKAVVGAQSLDSTPFGMAAEDAASNNQQGFCTPGSLRWVYQPAAGTYTVKLQAYAYTAGVAVRFATGITLMVREWGD